MRGPDFICVGAQKAGTTTLYDRLSQHPEITLPNRKEIRFFNHDPNWKMGLDYYLKNFSNFEEGITGDITPDYFCYDYVPERIYKTLGPNVKLIFMLREPVSRAYSQFNHFRRLGVEKSTSFEDYLSSYSVFDSMQRRDSWNSPEYYVERGFYLRQINNYLKFFDTSNMLFVNFDDFVKNDKDAVMSSICGFLGVESIPFDYSVHSNEGFIDKSFLIKFFDKNVYFKNAIKYFLPKGVFGILKDKFSSKLYKRSVKLTPELKNKIFKKYYYQEVDELEKLTGLDLSSWRGD